jgi:hypothetical protein
MSPNKLQREYLLLRLYNDNISARGFLLRVPFIALDQIEKDTWFMRINDKEKPRVRSLIQIDIISKIQMYIEDLAILAESFLRRTDFYNLLSDSNVDIGNLKACFVKKIESLTNEQISQIMTYTNPDKITSDDAVSRIFKKHFDYHIEKVQKKLIEIGSFGDANHRIYERFKHAGMVIFSNSVPTSPSGPLGGFETISIVADGPDPFHDITFIPYSQGVLSRYEKIIIIIQELLQDMIRNRMASILRNIEGIIPESYNYDLFTNKETQIMHNKFGEFMNAHPENKISGMNFDINSETLNKVLHENRWYFKEEQ